jgi:hypothetical protein
MDLKAKTFSLVTQDRLASSYPRQRLNGTGLLYINCLAAANLDIEGAFDKLSAALGLLPRPIK